MNRFFCRSLSFSRIARRIEKENFFCTHRKKRKNEAYECWMPLSLYFEFEEGEGKKRNQPKKVEKYVLRLPNAKNDVRTSVLCTQYYLSLVLILCDANEQKWKKKFAQHSDKATSTTGALKVKKWTRRRKTSFSVFATHNNFIAHFCLLNYLCRRSMCIRVFDNICIFQNYCHGEY